MSNVLESYHNRTLYQKLWIQIYNTGTCTFKTYAHFGINMEFGIILHEKPHNFLHHMLCTFYIQFSLSLLSDSFKPKSGVSVRS